MEHRIPRHADYPPFGWGKSKIRKRPGRQKRGASPIPASLPPGMGNGELRMENREWKHRIPGQVDYPYLAGGNRNPQSTGTSEARRFAYSRLAAAGNGKLRIGNGNIGFPDRSIIPIGLGEIEIRNRPKR